jgi:hypothetical protein
VGPFLAIPRTTKSAEIDDDENERESKDEKVVNLDMENE